MIRSLHEPLTHSRRGFWLAMLAALAHLWLPLLHAHHDGNIHHGAPAGLIPVELHGEPCIAGVGGDTGAESGSRDPAGSVAGNCECLTCKVLQAGALPAAASAGVPAAARAAPTAVRAGRAVRTQDVTLPPSRAPPPS
jgi:hypothetical protein